MLRKVGTKVCIAEVAEHKLVPPELVHVVPVLAAKALAKLAIEMPTVIARRDILLYEHR